MEVWTRPDRWCRGRDKLWADGQLLGQVKDTDDNRPTGFDDTICPVDFTEHGQISSEIVSGSPNPARRCLRS